MKTTRSRTVACAVLLVLSSLAQAGEIAVSTQPIAFKITAPLMTQALIQFTQQSGLQLAFPVDGATQLPARQVIGNLTVTAALEQLLQGSGLRYEFTNERTVSIWSEKSSAGPVSSTHPEEATRSGMLRLATSVSASADQNDTGTRVGGNIAFAADSSSASVLEEVVVTAEKRSENIQVVPTSVSALRGEKLVDLGLNRLVDYAQYVPGLNIQDYGSPGVASVTLRGIAPVGPGSVVGYYIDDTPLGSSSNYAIASIFALDMMPYDLERFEVLRGPQGTLYGAGSMGGLIKYVLKQADPGALDGQVGGELSTINGGSGMGYTARAAVNVPLIQDVLAVRASIYDRKYQGYTDDVFINDKDSNTGEQYGGRVALTWKPWENLRVSANALWNRLQSDDNAAVTLGNVTTNTDNTALFYRGQPMLGTLAGSHPFLQPFAKKLDYYSATINYDAPYGITITSATSWSDTTTTLMQDTSASYGVYPPLFGMPAGYSDYLLDLELKKFTQELRATSATGGRFEWLIGGFYTDEKNSNYQLANVYDTNYQQLPGPVFSPFFFYARLPSTYQEYAAFGDLTLNITPKFALTGGLRYASNSQDFRQISDGVVLGGFTDMPGHSSEDITTWSVSGRYRFTDDVMLYAKVATGYRPGGPNAVIAGANPTVGSDTLTSYEAGIKSTFLNGRALLNVSAFDIDWENIQLAVTNTACNCSYLANAGNAYSRGVELEGSLLPVEGLRLGFNAAYTKARLTRLVTGAPPYLLDFQLPGVPEWSAGLAVDYSWSLTSQLRASVGAGIRYVGEQNVSPVSAPGSGTLNTINPAYTTGDLRAGLAFDRYKINLFVRNFTNKIVYLSQTPQQNPVTGAVPVIDAVPLQPRVIGISVDASF